MPSLAEASLRLLLQTAGGELPAGEDAAAELETDLAAAAAAAEPTGYTLDIRIAAVFVILFAGLVGGLPPLFLKVFKDQASAATRLLRAFAGGVILALALVHIIPDGLGDMETLVDFPVGGATVLFGVIFMVLLENASQMLLSLRGVSQLSLHAHTHAHNSPTHPAHPGHGHSHSEHQHAEPIKEGAENAVSIVVDDHTHACLRTNTANNWLLSATPQSTSTTLRQQVAAYVFEFGCLAHSFLIGLTLGVTVVGRSEVVALLIALAFHQLLEGLGLGSVVIKAGFSRMKSVLMILTYSFTTPVGVAIGIAIADTYNAESTKALAVQGTLNCVSGGMLLYISLVQLIAEDFSREDSERPATVKVKLCSYVALCMGAGCMCMLAVWA